MIKGEKIIAIDKCIMITAKQERLTIGKEYIIKEITNHYLIVVDDVGEDHRFPKDKFNIFFKHEEKFSQKKSKAIRGG